MILETMNCVRKLTPRECEKLQGFPPDWTKYGETDELMNDTQRYKCCGNAVTTNVITYLINEMFSTKIIFYFFCGKHFIY